MRRLLTWLDKYLEESLLVSSLVVTVGLIFVQVVRRYVFHASLSWSEELARYIFVWQIWLGASFAVKHQKHIRVEFGRNLLPEGARRYLDVLVLLLWLTMSLILVVKGGQLTEILLARGQLSPAMRLPMAYAYAAVPVGCALMVVRLLQELWREASSLLRGVRAWK